LERNGPLFLFISFYLSAVLGIEPRAGQALYHFSVTFSALPFDFLKQILIKINATILKDVIQWCLAYS
jgi:hypothetical protein